MSFSRFLVCLVVAGFALMGLSQNLPAQGQASDSAQRTLSAAELFVFADAARDRGDYEAAEAAYRALTSNPDIELRAEARFRLALMLADRMQRHRDAAVLLRQILDEKPDAAGVRVELARMQAVLGNLGAAERELRAAQAAGLPQEVERMVRFFAAALRERKPFGGSLSIALAPDNNINRATRSDTLDTIIGEFDLDEGAQARSGLGLNLKGQAYLRQGLSEKSALLLRASAAGRFFRDSEFDDYALSLQAGPQTNLGADRLSVFAITSWRWYGQQSYGFSYGANANLRHPTGKRSALTLDAAAIRSEDHFNDLRDAMRYSLSANLDRAFTARFGGGVSVSGNRAVARDPGYSTVNAGLGVYVFHEFGPTTLVVRGGYNHLEADKRLFLYPRRRVDDRFDASITGTFRSLRVGSFAPLASIKFETNQSTVELYKYQRIAAELGITAAF